MKFYFFSGHDCTETYGCSPLQGSFTPFIHRAFKPEVSNCILDGEVVIYSSKLNCIGDYYKFLFQHFSFSYELVAAYHFL